ncbi:MAG: hypothetical protein V4492_07250 [Chlamydiota bacterium]
MSFMRQFSLVLFIPFFTPILSLHAETIDRIYTKIHRSAEKIQAAVDDILSTPTEQQTFENTLKAWYEAHCEIENTSSFLNAEIETDFPDRELALDAIQEYQSFVSTIFLHLPELYDPLFFYAKNALVEDCLHTSFHRHLAHLVGVNCDQFKESMSGEDREVLSTLIKLKSKARKSLKQPISPMSTHVNDAVFAKDSVELCGEISAGAKADTDGKSSADISLSGKSDDGRFSGRMSGEISRDSDGKVKGSVEARGTYEFNN